MVMIEWVDSARPIAEWQYLIDYKKAKPISCISEGFLICDDDDVKALAPNMGEINGENLQVCGIIHIPTCSISKITELTEC